MRLWKKLILVALLGSWPFMALAQTENSMIKGEIFNEIKPFTGIVGVKIQVQPIEPEQLVLTLQSDLPIQSKIIFLDQQHLGIELYNARLSQSLLAQDGSILCSLSQTRGVVQRIQLKSSTRSDPTQILVLTGPDIGSKSLQIVWDDLLTHSGAQQGRNNIAVTSPNLSENYNLLFQNEAVSQYAASSSFSGSSKLITHALSLYKEQNYEEALQQVRQALALSPKNADLYAALGETELKLKHDEDAVEAYEEANHLMPVRYSQRYAQVLILTGKRLESLSFLENLYAKNPKQRNIAYMLGTLYEEDGLLKQAIVCLKQALLNGDHTADTQYNLGLAYELSGDSLQAEKYYQQALRLNGADTDTVAALKRVSP